MTIERRLSRWLSRLEALAAPAVRVWIEDDDGGMLTCEQTGERIAVEDAGRLGAGDICARYVSDWSGHEPEP